MRIFAVLILALATAAAPSRMLAQQPSPKPAPQPDHFYRLKFSVEQVGDNGKITNSRSYFMAVETGPDGRYGQMRVGSRIPFHTGSKDTQYMNVGVDIDVNQAKEMDGRLALQVTTDISSLANTPDNDPSNSIVRQNRWMAQVIVPISKPTVIFSSDNLDNKGKMQVELTATRIE